MTTISHKEQRWDLTQSPFASVIHTNYVPSAEELIQLKSLLIEPKTQLTELEPEVARLQNLLERTKKYVDAHSALISPLRRLPVETLVEIFVHCLPAERYAIRDVAQAPILLTTISREWRQIAISTPALWKSLHVYIPCQLTPQAIERRAIGSALWLERSRTLPISISLCTGTTLEHRDVHVHHRLSDTFKFMETLQKFGGRIKEFSFTGPMADIVLLDTLDKSINFPILDTFFIRATEPGLNHGDLPFTSLIQRMPSLQKLTTTGFYQDSSRYNLLKLDWGNLTELTIRPDVSGESIPTPADLWEILARTRRLRILTVTLFELSNWDNIKGRTVIDLPEMREIQLDIVDYIGDDVPGLATFLSSLFYSFRCPSLKGLSVQSNQVLGLNEVLSSPWLSPQGLEKLSINMPMTMNSLFECLSLVPNLRFLEIGDEVLWKSEDTLYHIVNDAFLMRLVSNSSDNSGTFMCPHLQHIRIIVTNYTSYKYQWNIKYKQAPGITYSALLAFLESRVHTLQSCDIFFAEPRADESTSRLASEPTADDLQRLQTLRESGLRMKIRYVIERPTRASDDSPATMLPGPLRHWSSGWYTTTVASLDMGGRTGIII